MPKAKSNGIEIFYEVRGDGDPLLLIAGFACDQAIWSKVIHLLARHYRVVVFDNRGMGRTPLVNPAFTLADLAADAAAVLDALELTRVHVVGHSMGGLIAQELALAHPEKVRTLSILSSGSHLSARAKGIIESWGELPRLLDAPTATRLILPWIYTNAFFAKPGAIEQIIEQILSNRYPPNPHAIFQQSRAILQCDTSNRLGEIHCPTLVLVGSEDLLTPVAASKQLAHHIRDAKMVVLEDTGHGLLIESPDEVATAMLEFLSHHG